MNQIRPAMVEPSKQKIRTIISKSIVFGLKLSIGTLIIVIFMINCKIKNI